MAIIVVTEDNQTVEVTNGDTVVIDIPGGGTVNIVAADGTVTNFLIDYGDDDTVDDTVNIDVDSFSGPSLQILASGYDDNDTINLVGAENVQVGVPQQNNISFDYGLGLPGLLKILDPRERDLTQDPPPIVICFADGTLIDTPLGPCNVETLAAGDLVDTVDNGPQPVLWTGSRILDAATLRQALHLRPVRISAGALGPGVPEDDLIVSPQHRVLVSDWRAQLFFGLDEVLVPAKGLLDMPGIDVDEGWSGSYHHLLFDRHEVIYSNGQPSESLHLGEIATSALGKDAMDEIARLPGQMGKKHQTCRPTVKTQAAKVLATAGR
jgi:hypothetical protein